VFDIFILINILNNTFYIFIFTNISSIIFYMFGRSNISNITNFIRIQYNFVYIKFVSILISSYFNIVIILIPFLIFIIFINLF